MAKVFFPEKSITIPASCPPHPNETEYKISVGREDWDGSSEIVAKVQMVYSGEISGRRSPSYPVGTDDYKRVNEKLEELLGAYATEESENKIILLVKEYKDDEMLDIRKIRFSGRKLIEQETLVKVIYDYDEGYPRSLDSDWYFYKRTIKKYGLSEKNTYYHKHSIYKMKDNKVLCYTEFYNEDESGTIIDSEMHYMQLNGIQDLIMYARDLQITTIDQIYEQFGEIKVIDLDEL